MKKIFLFVLAIALPFLHGCSTSSSSQSTARGGAEVPTDLGVVEVNPGPFMAWRDGGKHPYTERLYTLSGGRECKIRFTPLANGHVLVEAVVLEYKQDKVVDILRTRAEAQYGEKVTVPLGNGSAVITAKRA